jgi:hypothetical protein
MMIDGQEIKVRPILVPDFPDLRDAYIAYTAAFADDKAGFSTAVGDLLTIALKNTDTALATDPDLVNKVDLDDVDEIVRHAAGRLWGEVLKTVADQLPSMIPKYIDAAGVDLLST